MNDHQATLCTIATALLLAACASGDADGASAAQDDLTSVKPTAVWHIDLENPIDVGAKADIFDIDLFDNVSSGNVAALHRKGRRVVCYFSAGSSESNRPDYAQLPRAAIGKRMDGWPENWLDHRSAGVRKIMLTRLDLAQRLGCDGVDPDNVDGYANDTGFPLSAADQVDYNRFLAREAHARGLLVGLKNDVEQIGQLVASFDFAVNEQCFEYAECDAVAAFTRAGKSVLNIEYGNVAGKRTSVCPRSSALGFYSILSEQNRLDGTFTRCR